MLLARSLIPDEAAPIVFAGLVLLLMLGLLRGRVVVAVLAWFCFLPVIAPAAAALLASLPLSVSLPLVAVVLIASLRRLLALLIGEDAANHAVGALAADALCGVLRTLGRAITGLVRSVLPGAH